MAKRNNESAKQNSDNKKKKILKLEDGAVASGGAYINPYGVPRHRTVASR